MEPFPNMTNNLANLPYLANNTKAIPANSYYSNCFTGSGIQPVYNYPYLLSTKDKSLQISYVDNISATEDSQFINIPENPDWEIFLPEQSRKKLVNWGINNFTLDWNGIVSTFVKGCPFLTFNVTTKTINLITYRGMGPIKFLKIGNNYKYIVKINNNQTWFFYFDKNVTVTSTNSGINLSYTLGSYNMYLVLANASNVDNDNWFNILDQYYDQNIIDCNVSSTKNVESGGLSSSTWASGRIITLVYNWVSKNGKALMLLLPHHLKYLKYYDAITDYKYKCVKGDLIPYINTRWTLEIPYYEIDWYTHNPLHKEYLSKMQELLRKESLSLQYSDNYVFGKQISRLSTICLLADNTSVTDVKDKSLAIIKQNIISWFTGKAIDSFVYDVTFHGINTKNSIKDGSKNYGFGIYNDHHYHLGYFIFAIATICKFDDTFYSIYKDKIDYLVNDISNYNINNNKFPYARHKDWYDGHSWAGGIAEFKDGKNQESVSEAVNAYYAVNLLAKTIKNVELETFSNTLLWTEIVTAQMYWQQIGTNFIPPFNKISNVGVMWSTKIDYKTWFGNNPEYIVCIQILPITPATKYLIHPDWIKRSSSFWKTINCSDIWKSYIYVALSIINPQICINYLNKINNVDNGNSLSNCYYFAFTQDGRLF